MSATTFNRPPLWRFVASMFRGFDGPLAFAVLVLMAIGLTAMYSAAFAFGVRFNDHLRNMLLAAAIMFVVAQLPPQKLMAFAISSFYCGIAGALYAYCYLGTVEPDGFSLELSFKILFMVIIGGVGSILGNFLGAAFILLLPIF